MNYGLRVKNYRAESKKTAGGLSATLKHSLLGVSLMVGLVVGFSALVPVPVGAQNATEVCEQIKAVDPTATCDDTDNRFSTTLSNILSVMSYAVGVISVIVIMIGAIMYGVSTGDPQKTKRAKDAILFAVVGIVVALLGQAIVRFVIGGVGQ